MNKNPLFVEMESFQFTKDGQQACGDDIQISVLKNENRYLAVLSDGLGSGIKAHILANMTTTMALRFMQSNMDTLKSVETIMDSLPVCEVRKISYATFTMIDLRLGGITRVIEMGNPQYIQMRGTEEVPPLKHESIISTHWPDRQVECYELKLEPGDRLIVCSDGVTQSGLGEGRQYRFGWRREGELEYIRERIATNADISSHALARSVAYQAYGISKNTCKDDISCLVIYMRTPRVMRLLTGPPYYKEHDKDYAGCADLGEDHTIVCGGTTANILERATGKNVEINLSLLKPGDKLPPPGRLPGVALVTEGILTLTRVCRALEQQENLTTLPTAARKIIDMMMQHDRIEFVVGTKVNEAHQDPNLPQDLELRRGVIRRISEALNKNFRKETEISFF
ncbi:MAG: SpoIIE family protein phosphatase [Lentisphaeria bacterium]|nr:SpoIIE family protein phosphatase [Lentisphaeria bacterium]MBO5765664.1 SpoIIE family protein phosphatase [Lentisphaeria bacterium]MBO7153778.1 SpoIIE family protein phosphatase [Lentisphaeria bacterium]